MSGQPPSLDAVKAERWLSAPRYRRYLAVLRDLVRRGLAMGKQVHDANVVAAALRWDASAIVTDNERHFRRFASLVPIETLVPGGTGPDL